MTGSSRPSRTTVIALATTLAVAVSLALPRAAQAGALQTSPPSATASGAASPVDAARRAVASGHLDLAVRDLAAYVGSHPADVDAARYLGDLYYRQADLAQAERVYRAILKVKPDDRETHNRLGGIYAAQDRIVDAIREFTASLPTSGAYDRLVELHMRLGDIKSFESQYLFLADTQPDDAIAQYNAGAVFHAERKYQQALIFLRRAMSLRPTECAILSEIGSTYQDVNDLTSARKYLDSCLHVQADYYPALVNIADVDIAYERFSLARTELERAHAVRPDGAEAMVDLGYLDDVSQHWRSAVSYYLQALGSDPLMREAYIDLGYDYDQHQLYALAEASFLKGISIAPNEGRLHYLLGVTYADQGKISLAAMEYRRAATSDEIDVARAASRELASLQKS